MTFFNSTRLASTIYRTGIYNWLLGHKPPKTVRVPKGVFGLSGEAAAFAHMQHPQIKRPDIESDGTFRWLVHDFDNAKSSWHVISSWLTIHAQWHPESWRAPVLAMRLTSWLSAFDRISAAIDPTDQQRWAMAILRQARHLKRLSLSDIDPWQRFIVHQGRINAALALIELDATLAQNLSTLGRDVDEHILGDGGHIERSPARSLAVLAILAEIRDTLSGHQIEPPRELISAMDRMVPFLKAMLHGDGGFALFGGTTASTSALIDAVFMSSGSKGRAMTSAPHTGFQRLRAGQTTLIVDCGETRVDHFGRYKGPASFELSVGKVRILSNCGARLANDTQQSQWSKALASTAAHSTLVINDKDADTLHDVRVERRDHEGARLIEMSHDGYADTFGLTHQRALYMDASGGDVRGEDVVSGDASQPFSIRFHLSPDVRASMVTGGGEVILKPPKGRGWRFTCRYPVMLEESVSFYDGEQHRAQQIVVLGNHEPRETTIKWRLKMEG